MILQNEGALVFPCGSTPEVEFLERVKIFPRRDFSLCSEDSAWGSHMEGLSRSGFFERLTWCTGCLHSELSSAILAHIVSNALF